MKRSKIRAKRKFKTTIRDLAIYFLIFFLWTLFVFLIFRIAPRQWWVVAGLLIVFFFALWLTVFRLFAYEKLGFFSALFLTSLLVLQLFRQLHWLNLILLSAFCFALFRVRQGKD